MIELECEICGVGFQASKKRQIIICPECAGRLRKIGLGPVQLLQHPKAQIKNNPDIKNITIKKMKDALGY